MKSYATFVITVLLTVALVFSLVSRERSKHEAPAEVVEVAEAPAGDAGVDGGADAGGIAAAAPEAGAPKDDKPLRVTTLGWEHVASGVALAPPPGGAPAAGGAIELAPEASLDAVEARLARGGADPQGADVAVLPLPAFVASFERLRALEPRAFLVVGFSHGREELRARSGALLKAPPGADEVKLVALGPSTSTDATARAAGSESATLLGLFALDLLGVAPTRIGFAAPGTPEGKAAAFAALVKGVPDERPRAFSTADASRLVPIVAVAPKALIDAREAAVRAWSKAWLDGLARAKSDVPGIARRLAAKDALPFAAGVGGAPEALVLVERLGQLENVGLDQQTSLIGPLAKGAVTLETLTQRTWQLARGGGITATAAPEASPIDARVVAAIAPPPKDAPPPAKDAPPADGDAGAAFGPPPAGTVAYVAYRAVEGDAEKVASQIAFLGGVFERAVFQVTAKGGDKAARAIAAAAQDKGVAAARLSVAPGEPQGAFAVVEVLSLP
ncbi:MAG: hypothetical protein KF782_25760 [Labilithrix sp.]|nr:hypothetical protein [Labilithrix sp.]